jgi:hypothetical protein
LNKLFSELHGKSLLELISFLSPVNERFDEIAVDEIFLM